MSREVTIEEVRNALIKNAQIVEKYGDAYMPTLLRLESEYRERLKKEDMMSRVAEYAKGNFDLESRNK